MKVDRTEIELILEFVRRICKNSFNLDSQEEGKASIEPVKTDVLPKTSKECDGMSVLVGTGNIVWSGLYILSSTVGLVVTVALLNILYVNPYKIDCWWYKGLLFLGCMVVSVLFFGGGVICLWHFWGKNASVHETGDERLGSETRDETTTGMYKKSGKEQYINTVCYGQRPDFGGMCVCFVVIFAILVMKH